MTPLEGRARRSALLVSCLALLVALHASVPAVAQCRAEEADKLLPLDGLPEMNFGSAVALDGEVAIIGASRDDERARLAGAAYIFRQAGGVWTEEQKLTASDASASAFFGTSVDVWGDVAIVGSFEHSDAGIATGAAYVFRHDGAGWVEERKLTLGDAEPLDRFGSAVGIRDDVAIVGADSRDIDLEDDAGAAYVYRYDGSSWDLEDTLIAADPNELDLFGRSADVDADVAIIGAFGDNAAGIDAGAAYIFRHLGGGDWTQQAKLTASDAEEDDLLGGFVAIDGEVAVASAVEHDELGDKRGAAFVFREIGGSWVEEQELVASDAEPFDRFGRDVSVSGDTILVGSGDDDFGDVSGAAYLYRFTGVEWVEQAKLTASALNTLDFFGAALAHDGEEAMIAAVGDSDLGAAAGAAYPFDIPALTLDIAQETAAAGDTLDIEGCGGVPGNSIGFAAVEFAGEAVLRIFDVGTVGPDGRWGSSLLIPDNPALPGNSARFLLRGLDRFGAFVFSNGDIVAFE